MDPMHRTDLVVRASANKYERAAVYVRDAMRGRSIVHQDKWAFFVHRVYINVVYVNFYRLMTLAYMALTAWEGASNGVAKYTLAMSEFRGLYYAVEALLLLVFSADTAMQYIDFGKERFWRKRWIKIKLGCLALFVLDMILSAAAPTSYLRIARALRPVMFIERNENIRKIVGSLLHTLPKIFSVVAMVILHIVLFGVFAFVLFAGQSNENCVPWVPSNTTDDCSTFNPKGCSNYFNTLGGSCMQLFILSTTANFPDVMMPVYKCNSWSGWFFVLFLVIGLYFLVNLTIAVTYTEFQELSKNKILKKYFRTLKGFSLAFSELTKDAQPWSVRKRRGKSVAGRGGPQGLTMSKAAMMTGSRLLKDDWLCFMKTLRPELPRELTAKLFQIMDVSNEGMIMEEEFQQLVYQFAQLQATEITPSDYLFDLVGKPIGRGPEAAARASISGVESPRNAAKRSRKRVCGVSRLDVAVWLTGARGSAIFDTAVLLNSILIVLFLGLEQHQDLHSLSTAQKVLQTLQFVTFSIFLLEISLKTIFCGPLDYFNGVKPIPDENPSQQTNHVMNPMAPGTEATRGSPDGSRSRATSHSGSTGAPAPHTSSSTHLSTSAPAGGASSIELASIDVRSHSGSPGYTSVLARGSPLVSTPEEVKSAEGEIGPPPLVARSGSPIPKRPRTASTESSRSEPGLPVYPLFVEGLEVTELWNVDPVFNKIDIACAVASIVALILNQYGVVDDRGVVAVTIFRMLRLFRAMRSLKGFMITLHSFVQVTPILARYFSILFVTLYGFAVVGMDLFAGKLSMDNPAVVASSYGVNHYWPNNFDSMRNSYIVLFEQLVVNNWPIVMEGCVAATSVWARLYFMLFYGFAVIAVLSILLAFLLEAFAVQREHNKKRVVAFRAAMEKKAGDLGSAGLAAVAEDEDIQEAWVTLLQNSHLDFSRWRLSRYESNGHVYEMLFKDSIQENHSYTLSSRQGARTMLARSLETRNAHSGAVRAMQVRRSLEERRSMERRGSSMGDIDRKSSRSRGRRVLSRAGR